jgi:hypothetical protein
MTKNLLSRSYLSTASPESGASRLSGVFASRTWARRLPHSKRERSRIGRGLARAPPGTQGVGVPSFFSVTVAEVAVRDTWPITRGDLRG